MLVTGAASGIGLACALRLVAAGHGVALVDRDVDRLDEAARACSASGGEGVRVSTHAADLSDPAAASAAVESALALHPAMYGVVNAAGAVRGGTAVDTTDADWRWNLDTNASSTFHVCRAVLPHLRRNVLP